MRGFCARGSLSVLDTTRSIFVEKGYEVVEKECRRCLVVKPESDFHRDKYMVDGLRSYCKKCVKEYDDTLRDERNRRAREVYYADPDTKIRKTHQYHLDHPEWSKERLRASHVLHREERAERAKERGKDPLIQAARRAATVRCEGRRRAVKAGSKAECISKEQYEDRLDEFEGCCYICDVELGADLHWDHYHPLSRGGDHSIENLFPACDLCNIRKNAVWPFTDERREEIRQSSIAQRSLITSARERSVSASC